MSEKEENFNFEKPSDLFNALESYFTRKQPKEAEHRHVLNLRKTDWVACEECQRAA